jgi:hypothetical protein
MFSGLKYQAANESGKQHTKLEMAEVTTGQDNVQLQPSTEHNDTRF